MKIKLFLISTLLISVYSCKKTEYDNDITLGNYDYDVIVYGNSSAAVTSAIAASRNGVSVLLISENTHLGGLTTSGLTATDLNSYQHVGGIAREFYQKIYAKYANPKLWTYENRDDFFERSKNRTYSGKNDALKMQWVFESKIARATFEELLSISNLKIVYDSPLRKVFKTGKRIDSIALGTGERFSAEMFIDASYGGDLMSSSEVTYTTKREARSKYDESYAGFHHISNYPNTTIGESIDPYITKGDSDSGLLPYINDFKEISIDSFATKTQAYCYRMTLTDYPENRVKIAKPDNYNPLLYEYLIRRIQKDPINIKLKDIFTVTPMPNRKTDSNGIDFVGGNVGWTEGSYAQRAEIEANHKTFTLGLIWFLQNDSRIPEHLSNEVSKWGLAKDEFVHNSHFPPQLYIRESRRMISDYVMTEKNCSGELNSEKSIGYGTYAIDSHIAQRLVIEDKVKEEGQFYKKLGNYKIDYRSIVPKAVECSNLFVPTTLSASHVAFGSIRMEPVFMILGHSAGTAAAICSKYDVPVQELDYNVLQNQLETENQIL